MALSPEEKKLLAAHRAKQKQAAPQDDGVVVLRGSRADSFLASIGLGSKSTSEPDAADDAGDDDDEDEDDDDTDAGKAKPPAKDPKPERSSHRFFG